MPEHSGGFTQEQLVIYKLGQIESQLASLVVKISESSQAIRADLTSQDLRIKKLEEDTTKDKNQRNVERAKMAGFGGALVLLAGIFKGFLEKWLGLSLPI